MRRLAGKRALVTGGTTGIGFEVAREFLEEGARVAITGRDEAGLATAKKALGDAVLTLQCDAGDPSAQRGLASAMQREMGQLDVLVLNAGVADLRPIDAVDEASFDRSFAINVKGPFFLLQALLPVFAPGASVVVNGSVNAHVGMPNTSVYGASKAALVSLVRTLSPELAKLGVRLNAVSPGPIATPLYSKLGLNEAQQKQAAAELASQLPAGRFGRPQEVAKAVVFLASDEAPFLLGSELLMDGGLSL